VERGAIRRKTSRASASLRLRTTGDSDNTRSKGKRSLLTGCKREMGDENEKEQYKSWQKLRSGFEVGTLVMKGLKNFESLYI